MPRGRRPAAAVPADIAAGHGEHDTVIGRQVTERLTEARADTPAATDSPIQEQSSAFFGAAAMGVSANLCDALAKLMGFSLTFCLSVSRALIGPAKSAREVIFFSKSDAAILRDAGRCLRSAIRRRPFARERDRNSRRVR